MMWKWRNPGCLGAIVVLSFAMGCDKSRHPAYSAVPERHHQALADTLASGKQYFIWSDHDPSEKKEFEFIPLLGSTWIQFPFKHVKLVEKPDNFTPLLEINVLDAESKNVHTYFGGLESSSANYVMDKFHFALKGAHLKGEGTCKGYLVKGGWKKEDEKKPISNDVLFTIRLK